MKLSEAIALGRTVAIPNDGTFTLNNGQGCACGMALVADGFTETMASYGDVQKHWPWVTDAFWREISEKYCRVARKLETLDELIDWVRSVEPADLPKPAPAPPAEQDIEALQTVPSPISTLREERKASHVHHERAVAKLVPDTTRHYRRTERSL